MKIGAPQQLLLKNNALGLICCALLNLKQFLQAIEVSMPNTGGDFRAFMVEEARQ
jgi:hypothetical protein